MARPWMPLYVADYLADTGHLSTVEHGAYMLLIMHYWQNRGLPGEDAKLARICRMSPAEWAESRDTLAALFDEGWRHGRIEEEMSKAEAVLAKRKEAGKASAASRSNKSSASVEHVSQQSSNHIHTHSPSQEDNSPPQSSEPREPDFSEKEVGLLVEQYPLLDIPKQLPDLAAWCDKRGILRPNERRTAQRKLLARKQAEAEGVKVQRAAATGPPIKVSDELAKRLQHRRFMA